jgi:hypothetical protein
MKKFLSLVLFFSPFLAVAQRDFDYTISANQCKVFVMTGVGRYDSTVRSARFTIEKKGNHLTIFSGGGPVAAYGITYRDIQNGWLRYESGPKNINIAPLAPVLRVEDGGQTIVYYNQ